MEQWVARPGRITFQLYPHGIREHWCSTQSIKDKRNFSILNITHCLYLRLRKTYLWTLSFTSNFKWISFLLSVLSCWQREKRRFSKTSCWLRFWRMCLSLAFILTLCDKQGPVNYNRTFCRNKQFFALTVSCEIYLDCNVV